MDNKLPEEFDLIVIGTGMVESIVSAAASRIGKTVLHIDKSDYYGGHWGSFNLMAIENLGKTNEDKKCEIENSLGNNIFDLKDINIAWHVPEKDKLIENKIENIGKFPESGDTNIEDSVGIAKNLESTEENFTPKTIEPKQIYSKETLLKDARKFNIDLAPKLHYARGSFVELLISSNIARYAEYRSVSRVLTWLNGQLEIVPCSRSDVFANNKVSVIEKRMLMKLLTSLDLEKEELQAYESKTFKTFLKDRKLTPNLIHYVLYAISRSHDETPCIEGIQNTKRFLESLGRFGKTPFLFSMYGSGETSQAFCRLSAVFGGVFALSQPLKSMTISENKITHLISGDQTIKAQNFVLSLEKAPESFVKSIKVKNYISRAVFITDRSVWPSEQEHLTLLMYPPETRQNSVTIIEMGTLTGTCPKGLFLVHLISNQQKSPKEDFEHIVQNLFDENFTQEKISQEGKPQILWSCYFSIPDTSNINLKNIEQLPDNAFLCSGPDLDLDYDLSIKKANNIFSEIYPNLEFLPRAPDPEEIIIGEEPENTENLNPSESQNPENNDLPSENEAL